MSDWLRLKICSARRVAEICDLQNDVPRNAPSSSDVCACQTIAIPVTHSESNLYQVVQRHDRRRERASAKTDKPKQSSICLEQDKRLLLRRNRLRLHPAEEDKSPCEVSRRPEKTDVQGLTDPRVGRVSSLNIQGQIRAKTSCSCAAGVTRLFHFQVAVLPLRVHAFHIPCCVGWLL
jgi:hypothetical protein